MKLKQVMLALSLVAISASSQAQTTGTDSETIKTTTNKESKVETDLNDAMKKANLTDDQSKALRKILDDFSKANAELKSKTALNEEQVTAEKKRLSDEKNAKVKELLGADKYKEWNAIRKEQREKAAAGN